MKFGEIISLTREEKNISQKELAKLLAIEHVHVTNQAISKWENGSTLPNAIQFLALCKILEITDIYGTFISKQRNTPFDRLNKDGQQKALEYIDLLIRSGLYTIQEPLTEIIPIRTLPLYHISVSAGTGQFLDSDHYDMIEVDENVPIHANFGVRISGDSMEPQFSDGQIVWVHQQQTIDDGEIGIFIYNGDAYCKKYKTDCNGVYLISLNQEYAPIQIAENDELRVFGKVVG